MPSAGGMARHVAFCKGGLPVAMLHCREGPCRVRALIYALELSQGIYE